MAVKFISQYNGLIKLKVTEDNGNITDVILDCEDYVLYSNGAYGAFSYRWKPTPDTESFLHLMKRVDKQYLLYKLGSPQVFDEEESYKETIDFLKSLDLSAACINTIEQELYLLTSSVPTVDEFLKEGLNIMISNGVSRSDAADALHICYNYAPRVILFGDMFIREIQKWLQTEE